MDHHGHSGKSDIDMPLLYPASRASMEDFAGHHGRPCGSQQPRLRCNRFLPVSTTGKALEPEHRREMLGPKHPTELSIFARSLIRHIMVLPRHIPTRHRAKARSTPRVQMASPFIVLP